MRHAQRAVGVLSVVLGILVSMRSEGHVWYGAVLVGLALLFGPSVVNLRRARE